MAPAPEGERRARNQSRARVAARVPLAPAFHLQGRPSSSRLVAALRPLPEVDDGVRHSARRAGILPPIYPGTKPCLRAKVPASVLDLSTCGYTKLVL